MCGNTVYPYVYPIPVQSRLDLEKKRREYFVISNQIVYLILSFVLGICCVRVAHAYVVFDSNDFAVSTIYFFNFPGLSTCGFPGAPAHSSVQFSEGSTGDRVAAGGIAEYTCDRGFELLGPARRVCSQNGTWSPQGIPFCGRLSVEGVSLYHITLPPVTPHRENTYIVQNSVPRQHTPFLLPLLKGCQVHLTSHPYLAVINISFFPLPLTSNHAGS